VLPSPLLLGEGWGADDMPRVAQHSGDHPRKLLVDIKAALGTRVQGLREVHAPKKTTPDGQIGGARADPTLRKGERNPPLPARSLRMETNFRPGGYTRRGRVLPGARKLRPGRLDVARRMRRPEIASAVIRMVKMPGLARFDGPATASAERPTRLDDGPQSLALPLMLDSIAPLPRRTFPFVGRTAARAVAMPI